MDFTILELTNLNVLAREGYCQLIQKNVSADLLQAALDTLKKIDMSIKEIQSKPKMIQESSVALDVKPKKNKI